MSDPGNALSLDEEIAAVTQRLGQAAVGRPLTADEAGSLSAILRAAAEALRQGHAFINRLAEHVAEERKTENVEEFFEDVIKTD